MFKKEMPVARSSGPKPGGVEACRFLRRGSVIIMLNAPRNTSRRELRSTSTW